MAYSLQPVILPSTGTGLTNTAGTTGFPSVPFNYLLFSEWVCLGAAARAVGVYNNVSFLSVDCNQTSVRVRLLAGVSHPVFDGTYTAAVGNILSHILVSADPVTQRIQVYLNDLPLTLTSGGWTSSGQFHISFNGWNIGGAGSVAPGPGIADLFIAAPATFFDLSVMANRRKFIHHNLTPVDLDTNAAGVLGVAPAIYLTVRPGGVANDFAGNNGTGGAFTIASPPLVFQTAGTCIPAPFSSLAMDNLLAFAAVKSSNLVFLEWSDDRAHSWSNPVSQPIGDRGEYRTVASWNRLGYARDRVFRITWSVPVATALQGAFIELDARAKT